MSNKDIASILTTIADLLQIKGESRFKVLAYRKAAESLLGLGRDVRAVHAEGGLEGIPGVGKAIADKIAELIDTGELAYFERLTAEVPASLASLLPVPDFGPKKVKLVWEALGVVDLAGLEAAATAGKLRTLQGMGERSEAKVLEGIAALSRRSDRALLGDAMPAALELLELLLQAGGVERAELAGSLRRRRETVGDIDILVATGDSGPVMQAFVSMSRVGRIIGHGPTKSSVEFVDGTRAQLWAHPPERFGTALQYATGSKEHNVRLRERSLKAGLSLSEHALAREDGTEILCATEEEVYAALDLPYIRPELREDRGEVQAAAEGRLPIGIEATDIRSQLHNHSTWSDGKASIREMADAAIARGLSVLAITDHTNSLGIVQGVDSASVRLQREEIDAVRAEVGDRLIILHGAEVEIKADGTLDFDDETLAWLDIVVASMHIGLRHSREQVTQRMLQTVRNPHVDIIGHPTGRLLGRREGADLDMDAVLAAAVESGVALEINANPMRLDLNDIYARRAVEFGIPISINTDAHAPEHFDFIEYGVGQARRAWVQPEDVINTWPSDRLLAWLTARG